MATGMTWETVTRVMPHCTGDGCDDQHRPGFSQGVVEPHQGDEQEEAAEDCQPGADEEGPSGVLDVGDPPQALLPGLRDEGVDAARDRQYDTDEEAKHADQSTHRAHRGETQPSHFDPL